MREQRICLWYIFAEVAAEYASAPCIWSRTDCYTYKETHDHAVRYAQWLLAQGVRSGELVAIYLPNSPEFLFLWLGLCSVGAAPAFINYNLEGRSLLHCLDVCRARLLIVDDDEACQKRIEGSRKEIEDDRRTRIVLLDDALKQEVAAVAEARVPSDDYREGVTPEFPICIIYTRQVQVGPGTLLWLTDQWHNRASKRFPNNYATCVYGIFKTHSHRLLWEGWHWGRPMVRLHAIIPWNRWDLSNTLFMFWHECCNCKEILGQQLLARHI